MTHKCMDMGAALTDDVLLREHFPYVRLSEGGDFIIPADKVAAFVQKYMDLADSREHLEQLRLYRETEGAQRSGPKR